MDVSQGNSNSLPPFLTKTYEMVDDESTNEIVSWSSTNSSFIVWNPLEFAKDLLPKYFKHNNFSSFVRQLNTYGFHKVDPDLWEFANEDFIKGERHRLKNIHRRKPIFSHSSQNGSARAPLSETERHELEDEIERLKQEKTSLISQLSKQAEIKQEMDSHMQSLEEKLQGLENRQKGLIDYLSQIVNKPEFISNVLRQHKRRRQGDADSGEIPILPLSVEPFERVESSLNSLENFFRGASEAFGQEDLYYDRIAPDIIPNSTVVLTELHESNSRASSPEISVPEIFPAIEDNARNGSNVNKVKEIDMNSEPNNAETESSVNRNLDQGQDQNRKKSSGKNDVFWEQFLTEHPPVNNEVEVQSERRDEREGSWLEKKNMECLTEKMVNLSSVENT